MALIDKIRWDLETAVKERDEDKIRTLRFLVANIKNLEIEKYPPEKRGMPTDEDVAGVVGKLVKTHKESIEAFLKGGRQDLVLREEKELFFLKVYLPEELSEEEIKRMVLLEMEKGERDFGRIMKQMMGKVRGQADGGLVAKIVKEALGD